jgi:hypothetical protein
MIEREQSEEIAPRHCSVANVVAPSERPIGRKRSPEVGGFRALQGVVRCRVHHRCRIRAGRGRSGDSARDASGACQENLDITSKLTDFVPPRAEA